jgi:hypothetical protein
MAIMDVHTRRTHALAILERTGMLRNSYAPPLFRVLWRLGMDVPPPHFMGFWTLAAGAALWFGVVWGGIMWCLSWSRQHQAPQQALMTACATGVMFGLALAAVYAWGRQKYGLPAWKALEKG